MSPDDTRELVAHWRELHRLKALVDLTIDLGERRLRDALKGHGSPVSDHPLAYSLGDLNEIEEDFAAFGVAVSQSRQGAA